MHSTIHMYIHMSQYRRPQLVDIMTCIRSITKLLYIPMLRYFDWVRWNPFQCNWKQNTRIYIHENECHFVLTALCKLIKNQSTYKRWRYQHRNASCLVLLNRLLRLTKGNIKGLHYCPFVREIHRWPVHYKGPVTRNLFAFDDVIKITAILLCSMQSNTLWWLFYLHFIDVPWTPRLLKRHCFSLTANNAVELHITGTCEGQLPMDSPKKGQ